MSKMHGAGGRFDARLTKSPLQVEVPAGNPLHYERVPSAVNPIRENLPSVAANLLRVPTP